MIKRISLNEQIYQALKADILEQRIGFGEKLTNRELQERFGVSSTPVRDAINRLCNNGLLENITNVGARVIPFDAHMALDINEIIAALHREAAALSLKKGLQNELIPVLRLCVYRQTQTVGTPDYFAHDRSFHQAFFDFCDNEYLKKIYFQHSVLWELLVLYYHKDQGSDRAHAIIDHQNILTAYEEGNVSTVQMYIEAHFQGAIKPLAKMAGQKV